MNSDFQIKTGVIGGTLLSAVININLHDVLITSIMAIVGATVSFFVSYLLKKVFSKKE